MQKKFTVQYVVTEDENTFNEQFAVLKTLKQVSDVRLLKTETAETRIRYSSNGAIKIKRVDLTFEGKVSKDAVEDAINYWATKPYVGKVSKTDWVDGKAVISVDVSKTSSHDVAKRNILEELLDTLENGSPERKNYPYGKALQGLGKNKVKKVDGTSTPAR